MNRGFLKTLVSFCLVVFATMVAPSALAAGPPAIAWQKAIGAAGTDWFRSADMTEDDGFIAAGAWSYVDGDEGPTKAYLVKTDSAGQVIWEKQVGGSGKSVFHHVVTVADGYVASGYTNSLGAGGFDAYLVKTNLAGDVLWQRTFGGTGDDKAYSLERAADGGFVLAGEVMVDPAKQDVDALLVKTDSSGNQQWQKAFGSDTGREGSQVAQSVALAGNGGYAIAGFTAELELSSIDVYMVLTGPDGEPSWEKTFGGEDTDWASSVTRVSGGFLLAGVSGLKARMWKTDDSGEIGWERSYADGLLHHAFESTDGEYLGAGYASLPGGSINAYAVAVDASSGSPGWEVTFGGGTLSSAYEMLQTADGGIACAGVTNSQALGALGQDGYLEKFDPFLPGPRITGISPPAGPVGTPVTISGSGFGIGGGDSSYVSFGGVRATGITAWSDGVITCVVPSGSNGALKVRVTAAGVTSAGAAFSVVPVISGIVPAAGAIGSRVTVTGASFGDQRETSRVSFAGVDAADYVSWSNGSVTVAVPEGAKSGTVRVTTSGGTSNGVPFTVTDPGPGPGPEPEPEPGTALTPVWYLAEGSSDWGFETYVTIMNPNDSEATARVLYMTSGGPVERPDIRLPALSQTVINPREDLGPSDFSTRVECVEGEDIAVDRRMIWTGRGALSSEGHASVGVSSPARRWYLPEGSTDWGFECWLLVQNPNSSEANCTVTYMIEGKEPVSFEKKVPARSRATFNMADDIGAEDASIMVDSDKPVIPERAMYRNGRRSGHGSIGTTVPAKEYYLAEGSTAHGFTTYVLVQNPGSESASVTLTYMTEDGPVSSEPFPMPPGSRKTVRVNDHLPGRDFSTKVSADRPVIAERAMYWGEGTPSGEACHDSIGMRVPHAAFYLPDGETTNGHETWTLVANPNAADVEVEISYLTPSGAGNVTRKETVPAGSRRTYGMLEHSGIEGRAAILVASRTKDMKIMVERAMYWSERAAGTDTIGAYSE